MVTVTLRGKFATTLLTCMHCSWLVLLWEHTLPSLNSSMKSNACFSITLIESKMLLLKTPWGWGPTSSPATTHLHQTHFTSFVFSEWHCLWTYQQGAWLQSGKWSTLEVDVHWAEQDNWLVWGLSAKPKRNQTRVSYKNRNTMSHSTCFEFSKQKPYIHKPTHEILCNKQLT